MTAWRIQGFSRWQTWRPSLAALRTDTTGRLKLNPSSAMNYPF
jgi:hypothetical protein